MNVIATGMNSTINIGIDTGGTYTDAVILRTGDRVVLASAKAITTKGDYAMGILEALKKVLKESRAVMRPRDVSVVCLSTTLATNSSRGPTHADSKLLLASG